MRQVSKPICCSSTWQLSYQKPNLKLISYLHLLQRPSIDFFLGGGEFWPFCPHCSWKNTHKQLGCLGNHTFNPWNPWNSGVPSPQSLAMPEAIRREAYGPRRWWLPSAPSSTFWQFKTNFCAMELDKWTFWRASKKWPGVHGITWEKKHLCCYIHNNIGILPQQVPSVQKHEAPAADRTARVQNQWDEKGRIFTIHYACGSSCSWF